VLHDVLAVLAEEVEDLLDVRFIREAPETDAVLQGAGRDNLGPML
jgi:hypothetical protein